MQMHDVLLKNLQITIWTFSNVNTISKFKQFYSEMFPQCSSNICCNAKSWYGQWLLFKNQPKIQDTEKLKVCDLLLTMIWWRYIHCYDWIRYFLFVHGSIPVPEFYTTSNYRLKSNFLNNITEKMYL